MYGYTVHKAKRDTSAIAKIYTDASVDIINKICTVAVYIEVDNKNIKKACQIPYTDSITLCEALAVIFGLQQLLLRTNIRRVICHIDSDSLFEHIKTNKAKDILIREAITKLRKKFKKFNEVNIMLIDRLFNDEAHKMAIQELRNIRCHITQS